MSNNNGTPNTLQNDPAFHIRRALGVLDNPTEADLYAAHTYLHRALAILENKPERKEQHP